MKVTKNVVRHLEIGVGGLALVLAVVGLSSSANADTTPIVPTNPAIRANLAPILIDYTRIPRMTIPYALQMQAIQTIRPVSSRQPAVAMSQLRPETAVTVGLFDAQGRVDGSRDMTMRQIQTEFDAFGLQQTQAYESLAASNPRFSNLKVISTKEVDPATNQEMEVIRIPMAVDHVMKLANQVDKFAIPGFVVDKPQLRDADYQNSGNYGQNLGNDYFGAYMNAAYDTYNSKSRQVYHANFGAGGYVFGKRVPLVDLDGRSASGQSSYSYLSTLGIKVWETSSPSVTANLRFERSDSARIRIWLGPVPLSVGGSVGGALGANLAVKTIEGNRLVNANLTPFVDSYGSVDAAVDAYVASAGVEGNLRIVSDSLPINANVAYDLPNETLSTNLRVDNTFDALSGNVSIFAKINYLIGSKKWSKSLFSWAGFHDARNLMNETISIPLRDYIGYKYRQLGGASGFLGAPTSSEAATPGNVGRYVHYQGGSIYWSPATGAHETHGYIRQHWAELGWEQSFLGFPTSDELATGEGRGRYQTFQGGVMVWSAATGAHEVHGAIAGKYNSFGGSTGFLGFPTTDESTTPDGVGKYNHFEGGSVYWTPSTGAFEVHGLIRQRWAEMGWERSFLRYPTSDELTTADGQGKFSNFQGGAMYYSGPTGARAIQAFPLAKYRAVNAEKSCLGYPTGETAVKQVTDYGITKLTVYNQAFQNGTMEWTEQCNKTPFNTTCSMAVSEATVVCNPPIVVRPFPRPIPFPR